MTFAALHFSLLAPSLFQLHTFKSFTGKAFCSYFSIFLHFWGWDTQARAAQILVGYRYFLTGMNSLPPSADGERTEKFEGFHSLKTPKQRLLSKTTSQGCSFIKFLSDCLSNTEKNLPAPPLCIVTVTVIHPLHKWRKIVTFFLLPALKKKKHELFYPQILMHFRLIIKTHPWQFAFWVTDPNLHLPITKIIVN